MPCFENMPIIKVDGNLVHTPYDLNKDTNAIKSPQMDGVSTI
jgi:hypothetical protein